MEVAEASFGLRRKTGRPLSFDREAALEQAMLTFWRHGYETTSIVDLTTAMGITAPSLYGAFGDKQRLFLEAMHRYAGDSEAVAQAIDKAPTAYDAARRMLRDAAIGYTGEATPKGCLLASATASGSTAAAEVQLAVAAVRQRIEAQLRGRLERDIATGVLPAETPADALAGTVMAVIQGLSILARDGAPRSRLLAIVEQTLRSWPSEARAPASADALVSSTAIGPSNGSA